MKKLWYTLALLFLGVSLSAQDNPLKTSYVEVVSTPLNTDQQAVVLENVHYIDVIKGRSKSGSILLAKGKIQEISKTIQPPKDALVIDGDGKWLIPGLVDAHIHLFQSGGLYTRPDALNLTEYKPYEEEREWLRQNAPDLLKRYLKAGITTVLDVGGPMYNYKIRDDFNKPTEFPNVFLTGPLISTYQPKAFDITDPPIIKANNSKEAVQIVNDQLPARPDFIKIWYIASSEEEAKQNFDLVKATVEESHKNGLKVAIHATQLYTAKLAVKAGGDILVHSVDDPVDKEFITLLKKNKTIYIPTLIVGKKYFEVFGQHNTFSKEDFALANPMTLGTLQDVFHYTDNALVKQYKAISDQRMESILADQAVNRENLKKLQEAGVVIATGTDAGNIGTLHASSYYEELDEMKTAGLSNAEILKASTYNGAVALDKEKLYGSIEPGKMADLVLLNSNPLDNLDALKQISHVIKGGTAYAADGIIESTPEQLVQQQLNAYNAGDVEAFLAPYSEDVELYTFPDKLTNSGKENIRPSYTEMFKRYPELHCELANRMVMGNTVIDYEWITGITGFPVIEAIAIYKIENGKIAKVYFVR